MRNLLRRSALFAAAALLAAAQDLPRSTASAEQTFRGVLMDASCQVIQSQFPASKGASAAPSSQVGGAAANTASGAGASGSLSSTTNSGGTGGAANETPPATSAKTGVSTDQSGSANSNATASGSGASGSSSITSYTGTTSASADQTGTRSRANADTEWAGTQWTTVREKYSDCKLTSSTNSWALMSNGNLYMLDGGSDAIKTRASSNTGSDWYSITVIGSMNGKRIAVTSAK